MPTRHRETSLFDPGPPFSQPGSGKRRSRWIRFSHRVECERDRHAIQHDRVKTDSNQQLPLWDLCPFQLCQLTSEEGAGIVPRFASRTGRTSVASRLSPADARSASLWMRVEVVAHCPLRATPGESWPDRGVARCHYPLRTSTRNRIYTPGILHRRRCSRNKSRH
jgi:hypothetical protein